jgi:hypothetical protein
MVENDTGFDNKGSVLNAKVEAVAVSGDETLIDAFKKGTFSGDTNYTPTL